jgi:predicted dehydrogenase
MIEACARAGVKGIFCEKPFVAAPADLARIESITRETGVKIVVAHIRRQLIAFRRAKQRYNDGSVGEPVLCMAGIKGWDLSEWGAHWLDMFRMFHDDRPATWVFGQARVRETRGYGHAMEDHGIAYFEFEGGAKGFLDGGGGLNGPDTMTLTGSEGIIHVRGEHTLMIENGAGRSIEDYHDHKESNFHWTWERTISELVAWMDGGPEPALGHTNMIKTAELNLAAYLSCLLRDRVDLPLEDAALDEWPVDALARLRTE